MEEDFKKMALVACNETQQEIEPVAGPSQASVVFVDKSSFFTYGPRAGQAHVVTTFEEDIEARTEDPKRMEENYRIPLTPSLVEGQVAGGSITTTDLFREFIISPGFASAKIALGSEKTFDEILPLIEKFKGKYRVYPEGLRKLDRLKYGKSTKTLHHLSLASRMKAKKKTAKKKTTKKSAARNKMKLLKRAAISEISSKTGQLTLVNPSTAVSGRRLPTTTSLVTISVKGNKVSVSLESLKCLKPKAYLNDEILNYFSLQCLKRFEDAGSEDFGFFPTHVWLLYIFQTAELSETKKLTLLKIATDFGTQPNLLRRKFFLIPVARERHWFLVTVCRPFPDEAIVNEVLKGAPWSQCSMEQANEIYWRWLTADEKPVLLVFDSMAGQMQEKCSNYAQFHEDTIQYVKRALLCIHQVFWRQNKAEALAKMATFRVREMKHTSVKVHNQPNNADCGIFCIANALGWLILTVTEKINYMTAQSLDFSLLFNHQDLEGERDKMFMDIKTNTPPEYHHHIDAVRAVVTVKEEPSDDSLSLVPVSSQPAPYQPMSKPFEQLHNLIKHNLQSYAWRLMQQNAPPNPYAFLPEFTYY